MSFGAGSSRKTPNRKPKPLGVDEDRFSTNEQAKPVPYFAGKLRLAAQFISDVFDVTKQSVTRDVGKQKTRTGTSYFASFAALIAHGPVDGIHAVILNGEQVWPDTDPSTLPNSLVRDVSNPDFVDLTIPDYGLIRFYWGTETQTADDYLRIKSGVTHPPYAGMCYMVAHQLFLGFNQTNIQNLEVIASRYPIFETSPESINDDANPVNVIYELLTHPRLGRGFDESLLDISVLEDLGTQLNSEGIGISPLLTTQRDALSWIVQVLEYIDGYPIISSAGLLSFGVVRPQLPAGLSGVDESVMISPPNITPEDWSSTFNETNVKFSDPSQFYDPNAKTWRDRGNFQVTGQLNTQTLERLWITNPGLAEFQATAIGRLHSIPEVTGTMSLRLTPLFDVLTPGTAFVMSYEPRGYDQIQCLVTERSVPDPARPVYNIAFRIDRGYMVAGLTVPSFTPAGEEPTSDPLQVEHQRLLELPAALCPDGELSLTVLCSRPEAITDSFIVHLAKNYDFGGEILPAESYYPIERHDRFAWFGELLEDYPASTDLIDQTIGIPIRLSGVDVELPEETPFDALADDLLVFIGNEIFSVIETRLIGINEYRLLVVRERFASTRSDHGVGDEVFVIAREDLLVLQHPHFKPFNTAVLKVQASTGRGSAPLEDQAQIDIGIEGRQYAEPPLRNLTANGDGEAPTYSAGQAMTIGWTLTDAGGELPLRIDLTRRLIVVDFYDSGGTTLLGSTTTPGPELVLTNAELQVLLGASEVSFQVRARRRTISDWWEIDTANATLNVTKV